MNDTLFDRLVQVSELSSLFARATLERALRRASVDPQRMNRSDLEKAIPEIRRSLSAFHTTRLDPVMTSIQNLARRPAA